MSFMAWLCIRKTEIENWSKESFVKILVTGSEGGIGSTLVKLLLEEGYELRTSDVKAIASREREHLPGDLRDLSHVRRIMHGVDAVVHLGAIPNDRDDGHAVMETNVMGTWNVLQSALECGAGRVVNFSSINAQGSVKGFWPCEYLPIDDAYPHHPTTPYQLAKHLGEEACRSFSERHGMITLSLRPTWVASGEQHYGFIRRQAFPAELVATEYWGYVDVRDVADAALRCLRLEGVKNDAFLLSANDTTSNVPTAELLEKFYANTPWKQDRASYLGENPFRALIDTSHAEQVLGWQPKYSWRE